jgi:hypothetical protein
MQFINVIMILFVSVSATTTFSLPKQFGFWGSAMDGAGRGNYIYESAANGGNTVMIRESNPVILKSKLEQARATNQKVILYIQNVLFPWASSAIYPDYPTRFQNYWAQVKGYEHLVIGFYIFDEPFWNNLQPGWGTVWYGFLQNALNHSARYLKLRFPEKLTYVTFTHLELDNPLFELSLNPREVDVVGVNCYIALGSECSENEIYRLIHSLQLKKAPHQKMILTADGYWHSNPTPQIDAAITDRLRLWKMLAASYGDVIAFFPFLYQSVPAESLYGLDTLPTSLSEISIYFRSLRGLLFCDTNDLIWIHNGSVIDRWVGAPMCTPRCERGDYVRRTAVGVLIDQWTNAPICPQ